MLILENAVKLEFSFFLIFALLFVCNCDEIEKHVIAKAGDDWTIQCNATFESVKADWKDVIKVLWMWKSQNETEWTLLDEETSSQETFEAEKLKHETRTNLVISVLPLYNLTLSDSGVYGCFLEESNVSLDETMLQVGYSPDCPTQLSCELNGKLSSLTCIWNPGQPTHIHTDYIVHYSVEEGHEFKNQSWPAFRDYVILNVATSYTFLHLIRVEAVNHLGSITSQTLELYPSSHVKTQPPANVAVKGTGSEESSSLNVSWDSPEVNFFVHPLYRVRYRQNNWDLEWINGLETNKLSYVLKDLTPYSIYDIQVAAKPESNDESFINGSWSEWTETETFRSPLIAPTQLFLFNKITATLASHSDNSIWKIEASWHLYSDPLQPGFYYEISYELSSQEKQHQLGQNNVAIIAETDDNFEITGRFCNSLGCSPPTHELILLKKAPLPVENVAVELKTNQAITKWKNDEPSFLSDESCQIRLCSFQRMPSGASLYKDYYDGHDDYSCQQEVADVTVPCSDGQATIVMSSSPCLEYYAIVHRLAQTGIQDLTTLSKPSFPETINPSGMTVETFSASDRSSENKYAIEAEWVTRESLCKELHEDTILSVLHTPVSGSECSVADNCTLKNPFHAELNDCSETSILLTTSVYGYTTYEVSLGRCCKPTADDSDSVCFSDRDISKTVQTAVGAPTIPLDLKWARGSPLTLSWSPPEHKNGKLDGYIVWYSRVSNKSPTKKEDNHEIVTSSTSVELPISCPTASDNSTFTIRLKAFNLIDGEKVFGPNLEQEAPLCDFVDPDWAQLPNAIALIAGLASSLFMVLLILGLSLYHRRRLKRSVRKYVWPTVPTPVIMVPISNLTDEKGNQYKDIYEDGESYSNSAYSSSRTVFRADIEDNESCIEIVDSVREYSNHSLVDNNNLDEEKTNQALSIDEQDESDKSFAAIKAKLDGISGAPGSEKATDQASSCFSFSNASSPAQQTMDTSLLLTSDSMRSTVTWQTSLYPNSANTSGASIKGRRPHSVAGSSGSSLFAANYVKNFVEIQKSIVSDEETISTQLAKFRLDEVHQKSTSSRKKEKFRQCRGISWYEGYSTSRTTSDFSSNPAFQLDVIRNDEEPTSPYVTLPYVRNESYVIDGITTDMSDDYCESEFISRRGSEEDDPPDVFLQTCKPLRIGFPHSHSPIFTEAHHERHFLFSGVSDRSSPECRSDLPLLECYSPTSPINGGSYVSMGDALSSSERFDPRSRKSRCQVAESYDKDIREFNFDKPYVTSTSSDPASYVCESESTMRRLPVPDSPKEPQQGVASYVTSADVNGFVQS